MIRRIVAATTAAVLLTLSLGQGNAAASTATAALRTSLLNAHNNARNCSNGDLALNSKLNTSAQHHANDMAERNYVSHNTLAPASAASGADYTSTDWGYRDRKSVV